MTSVTIHATDPFATPDDARSPLRRLRARMPATVTLWTAVVFGIGAAFGTSRAGRIIRRADWELRRLAP